MRGWTALHWAAFNSNSEGAQVASVMRRRRKVLSFPFNLGSTCCRPGQPPASCSARARRLLLLLNVDPRDSRRGDTPLHVALVAQQEGESLWWCVGVGGERGGVWGHRLQLSSSCSEIAGLLLSYGADVNARNKRRVNTFYHTFDKKTGKPKVRQQIPLRSSHAPPRTSVEETWPTTSPEETR